MKLREFGANMHRYLNAAHRLGLDYNLTPEQSKAYSDYMQATNERQSLEHNLACLRVAKKHLSERGEIERVISTLEKELQNVKGYLENEAPD